MTHRHILLMLVLGGVTGLAAYTATVNTRPASAPAPVEDPATESLLNWLDASPAQREELRTHDTHFATELRQLKMNLDSKRAEFITTIERPTASNDEIRSKLEIVLGANNALERRVADYLLSVRDHLTADQQRRLFGLCAEEVRHGRQWRGGRGPGAVTQPGGPPGPGGGRGWRGGRGPGAGR